MIADIKVLTSATQFPHKWKINKKTWVEIIKEALIREREKKISQDFFSMLEIFFDIFDKKATKTTSLFKHDLSLCPPKFGAKLKENNLVFLITTTSGSL